LNDDETESVEAQALQIIENGLIFAEQSPEPDISTLMEGVYA